MDIVQLVLFFVGSFSERDGEKMLWERKSGVSRENLRK